MITIHCDFCGKKIERMERYAHLYTETRTRFITVEDADAVWDSSPCVGYDICLACAKELDEKRRKTNDAH